jgi:hypothetical protein
MPQRFFALIVLVAATSAFGQAEGRFGEGLLAGEHYAAAPDNPVYTVMPLTVECWAKLSSKSAYNILAANEPKHSVTHWEIYADKGTGHFAAYLPAFAKPDVKSDVDIVDGKWHYLALTCDGQTAKLFVDAKEVGSAKLTKKFSYPDVGPLTFGYIEGVPCTKDGVIDEVRISRVVRAVEKTPEGPFVSDGDTVGLWHFDGDGKGGYADVSTTKNPAVVKAKSAATPVVSSKNRWAEMDFGPFFTSTLGIPTDRTNFAMKGISIRLAVPNAPSTTGAVCFDTELLRISAAWTGGFVKIYPAREGLAQAPDTAGTLVAATRVLPGWIRKGQPVDTDPRPDKLGPLPAEYGRYKGLYLNGNRVILSYEVTGVGVLETHDIEEHKGTIAIARTLEVAPADHTIFCRAFDFGDADLEIMKLETPAGTIKAAGVTKDGQMTIAAFLPVQDNRGFFGKKGSVSAIVPDRLDAPYRLKILIWHGPADQGNKFADLVLNSPAPQDLSPLTKGGPARWGDPLVTKGKLGDSSTGGAYVVDTLTAPEDNPFKSFLRFGGHDFFKNGDMAVCSISGDVWIVSGIDEKLEKLSWQRFATGLHQPLGLKIVDDVVYVLGRDQITRLHDLNGDGEADFYENFNNGCKVTTNGHGYATNLETDPEGNFYYTKCADNSSFGGTVVKVSKDGKYCEPYAVGLRNPNGLGISPAGFITEADNQGEWVPASRIDFVEGGKFLGYKPSAHDVPAPDMGKPICFLPQNIDNSSGGQVWAPADSDRWGPFKGDMLHTSYGASNLLHVMMEKVGENWQGGVVSFGLKFDTGIMRGRFNPKDGQLYVCGLRGWQTAGVRSGAVQRVRYTGRPVYMPKALHVHANGVAITFPVALERVSATDSGNYSVLRWTYKWTGDYPSRHFSVKEPKKQGYDTVEVKSAKLSKDGKTLFLEIPEIAPVLQQEITMNVKAADGGEVRVDLYQTIHQLGPVYVP